jgi:two-component system, chemotaxis family, chemotaxis protein CheY
MAKTVLVVDDAFSLRQLVAFSLQSAGFNVLEAGNGQEGLDQLAKHKVDLIISDLNMPVMDGITFVRNLRQMPSARYTPVLMLTTESQPAFKQEAKAAGATGWIVKPFQPSKLLETVAKVSP